MQHIRNLSRGNNINNNEATIDKMPLILLKGLHKRKDKTTWKTHRHMTEIQPKHRQRHCENGDAKPT